MRTGKGELFRISMSSEAGTAAHPFRALLCLGFTAPSYVCAALPEEGGE